MENYKVLEVIEDPSHIESIWMQQMESVGRSGMRPATESEKLSVDGVNGGGEMYVIEIAPITKDNLK